MRIGKIFRISFIVFSILFALFFASTIGISVFITVKAADQRDYAETFRFFGQDCFVSYVRTMEEEFPIYSIVAVNEIKEEDIKEGSTVLIFGELPTLVAASGRMLAPWIVKSVDSFVLGDFTTTTYTLVGTSGEYVEKEVKCTYEDIAGSPGVCIRYTAFCQGLVLNPVTLISVLILPAVIIFMLVVTGVVFDKGRGERYAEEAEDSRLAEAEPSAVCEAPAESEPSEESADEGQEKELPAEELSPQEVESNAPPKDNPIE
ncbi:MAG: hypothetical protein IJF71_00575 [Clostridia bacterium]|nr:hypothetical protein [Clostridia bacterium]